MGLVKWEGNANKMLVKAVSCRIENRPSKRKSLLWLRMSGKMLVLKFLKGDLEED
jgi:hypothetical protein